MYRLALGLLVCIFTPEIVKSDVILAARTLRSHTVLMSSDVILQQSDHVGGHLEIADFIGLEARVVLYQGRPISRSDLGPPAIVQRNQVVIIKYVHGALSIAAEGRSLGRAGVGEHLRVMNLSSRQTVFGTVDRQGAVIVSGDTSNTSN